MFEKNVELALKSDSTAVGAFYLHNPERTVLLDLGNPKELDGISVATINPWNKSTIVRNTQKNARCLYIPTQNFPCWDFIMHNRSNNKEELIFISVSKNGHNKHDTMEDGSFRIQSSFQGEGIFISFFCF